MTMSDEDGSDGEPASGAVTPMKTAEQVSTPTGTVRKSRGFLDLTPLSGFFKRNPTSSQGAAKAEPPLDDDTAGEATPTVPSAQAPANGAAPVPELSEAQAEGSGSGEDEDESDRRTIRASTSEDDVDEAKQRTKVHAGNGMVNGNGAALGHGAQVGEKVVEAAESVRSPSVVEGVS